MTKPLRMAVMAAASLAAMALAVLLVTWLLFDAERVKQQLQVRLGDALGMEVKIGQRPRFGLLGGASVRLADLE